ncbi:MAG TPA: DUF389 domain-containing protein [Solirubrobacterales bacterium]
MLFVQVIGHSKRGESIAALLDQLEGARAVTLVPAVRVDHSVASATIPPAALDELLDDLDRLGVSATDITVTRAEAVGQAAGGVREAGVVWSDVLGTAWRQARPIARYLVFMFAAGVIACYGVIENNAILIVGAMAVSPDLLPIVAIAVGVVGRNPRLAGTSLLTLAIGLGLASLAAAIFGFAQDQLDLLPSGFDVHRAGVLGGLVDVSDETIVVAFVAGAAGMLVFETRAASAIGVAISVTTIPAAAYLGVAAGLGELSKSLGALGVLGVNVAMMVLGASAVLWAQRRRDRRQVVANNLGSHERRDAIEG